VGYPYYSGADSTQHEGSLIRKGIQWYMYIYLQYRSSFVLNENNIYDSIVNSDLLVYFKN
jgi:hypothetical protein